MLLQAENLMVRITERLMENGLHPAHSESR